MVSCGNTMSRVTLSCAILVATVSATFTSPEGEDAFILTGGNTMMESFDSAPDGTFYGKTVMGDLISFTTEGGEPTVLVSISEEETGLTPHDTPVSVIGGMQVVDSCTAFAAFNEAGTDGAPIGLKGGVAQFELCGSPKLGVRACTTSARCSFDGPHASRVHAGCPLSLLHALRP